MLRALIVALIVLLTAVAIAWPFSHWYRATLNVPLLSSRSVSFTLAFGQLHAVYEHDCLPTPDRDFHFWMRDSTYPYYDGPLYSHSTNQLFGKVCTTCSLRIPLWSLVLLLAVVPVMAFSIVIARRCRGPSRCAKCGYFLATEAPVCSECGCRRKCS